MGNENRGYVIRKKASDSGKRDSFKGFCPTPPHMLAHTHTHTHTHTLTEQTEKIGKGIRVRNDVRLCV